ncbi:DUF998 domain-containing protein [Microbacterium gorillae]|uniref:DUF998 domain-containing protein n=1 Tax=Microbacterium gorillae TaxID=1231063 RepID=UPI0005900C49|nr:DUF998 domain-containing protein [Microbacterium gorillae]
MSMALALASAVFIVARFGVFVALHVMNTGYNVIEHAVSDYAVGRGRRLSTIASWLGAASWLTLGLAVLLGLPQWHDRVFVGVLLLVQTVIFVVLPAFPTDIEGEKLTTIGRVHYVAAIAWFAIAYALCGNFVRLFQASGPVWAYTTADIVQWVVLVSLVVLVVALIVKPLRARVFGLAERVFMLAVIVFYVVAALGVAVLVR